MASIQNRDGSFRVQIRRKGIELNETFKILAHAELWAAYKEDLIDLIDAFDAPLTEMITLKDAIQLKIERGKDTMAAKDISDYNYLIKVFAPFCDKKMNEISLNNLCDYFDELMKTPVIRGGSHKIEGTGTKCLPAYPTIYRKYAYLSTVYQMLILDGVAIENHALKVCQITKQKYKDTKSPI